jgi:CTD small phosphatase-like protein 2
MQDYADWVLDNLDPDRNIISHRLYRQHTIQSGLVNIKDISLLGRNMAKMIIVDNIADNFCR